MRFLMTYQQDPNVPPPTPEQLAAIGAYTQKNMQSGVVVMTGGLVRPTHGTQVKSERGKFSVTDGPFAETKDLIAGWMVIDVETYERALELAGELSAAPGAGGKPIHEWLEVRPFLAAPPTITE